MADSHHESAKPNPHDKGDDIEQFTEPNPMEHDYEINDFSEPHFPDKDDKVEDSAEPGPKDQDDEIREGGRNLWGFYLDNDERREQVQRLREILAPSSSASEEKSILGLEDTITELEKTVYDSSFDKDNYLHSMSSQIWGLKSKLEWIRGDLPEKLSPSASDVHAYRLFQFQDAEALQNEWKELYLGADSRRKIIDAMKERVRVRLGAQPLASQEEEQELVEVELHASTASRHMEQRIYTTSPDLDDYLRRVALQMLVIQLNAVPNWVGPAATPPPISTSISPDRTEGGKDGSSPQRNTDPTNAGGSTAKGKKKTKTTPEATNPEGSSSKRKTKSTPASTNPEGSSSKRKTHAQPTPEPTNPEGSGSKRKSQLTIGPGKPEDSSSKSKIQPTPEPTNPEGPSSKGKAQPMPEPTNPEGASSKRKTQPTPEPTNPEGSSSKQNTQPTSAGGSSSKRETQPTSAGGSRSKRATPPTSAGGSRSKRETQPVEGSSSRRTTRASGTTQLTIVEGSISKKDTQPTSVEELNPVQTPNLDQEGAVNVPRGSRSSAQRKTPTSSEQDSESELEDSRSRSQSSDPRRDGYVVDSKFLR